MTTKPIADAEPERWTIRASSETLLLAASVFWALAVNQRFFASAVAGQNLGSSIGFIAALGAALVALHFLLLAPFMTRLTIKPLLALVLVATAFAAHYMDEFGIYLDPSMLRNVMRTDVGEARELFTASLVPDLLLLAVLPLLVLWRVRVVRRGWAQALGVRIAAIGLAAAVLVGVVVAQYQPLASLMRNQHELRYLVTPANYLWSLASVAGREARAAGPKRTLGADARPGPSWRTGERPKVVVFVVGETARAANWGLGGYARQTTPELAALQVVNFRDVTSCGTNTEVSVPCMFSALGRRHYDESTIRGSESLLHVLARAGVGVRWRDNQAGCKGVCDGLPTETAAAVAPKALCPDGRCLDDALLSGLDGWLEQVQGRQLLVLHQLGNHGPAYSRRYPPAFERFKPACQDEDLRHCSRQEIVNAYDNAVLYTDHVLATLVRTLQAHADRVDATLVYVSDHGESLGENNFYLHGLPWPIAPAEQKKVPMIVWSTADGTLDTACLARRAAQPASHDNLFHLMLGLLDVQTSLYEPAMDLGAGCRRELTP
ncbi:phosphoethanolamine--lipid A transferase [Rubrivivax gelatinosus]|uniref:Phosphoethanolamine transferase n=1 Tax=Rubrivivax gelatinosus TaxID=28068 RepID=A0ABS1DVS8_RUBGE|nr:phosphoethanolamine transferase [Rubrivivax gelatinosus]